MDGGRERRKKVTDRERGRGRDKGKKGEAKVNTGLLK